MDPNNSNNNNDDTTTPPVDPAVNNDAPATESAAFAEPVEPAPTPEPTPAVEAPAQTTPTDAVAPAAAAGAASSTTPGASGPSPTPNPSKAKKIILIASIAGGALVLAIIGLVVFFLLTAVTKEDYREATQQYNTVTRANSELISNISSVARSISSASDSEFEEEVKEAETAIADIKTSNEELGSLKAMRFGDGAEVYNTFDKKLEGYLGYANELIASVKSIRPAMVVCDEVGDASAEEARIAALKDCSTALGEVNDIPNPEYKAYIASLKTTYADYATVYEGLTAIEEPFGSQSAEYRVLRDKLNETQRSIRDASSDFSDAVEKRDDEMSVKPAADALRTFLREKQQ